MTYEVYLAHHGIKGQRWGVRRYQNEDGSYTEAGKKRYAKVSAKADRKETAYYIKQYRAQKARDELTRIQRGGRQLRSHGAAKAATREAKANRKSMRSLKRTSKYFNRQVKKLIKKNYHDEDIKRFADMAEHLMSQRQLFKQGVKAHLPGAKADAAKEAMDRFLSVKASDAAKYQPTQKQEWMDYLWATNPFIPAASKLSRKTYHY